MRRSIATVGAVVLGLAVVTPAAPGAAAPPDPGLSRADRASLTAGLPVAPKAALGARPAGPNPYLAMVPDAARVDYSGWTHYLQRQASGQAAARLKALAAKPAAVRPAASAVVVDEDEPDNTRGSNDDPASAQLIRNFGTASGQDSRIRILGSLDPETVFPTSVAANPEDDGSIPLAGDTGIGAGRDGIVTDAQIGDGPHGSAGAGTNDFDFYKLTAPAGKVITVKTATPTGSLDTVVVLYDPKGNVLAANDDFGGSLDSQLTYKVPAEGTFYAMVAAYSGLPADPFDPASGDGGASEGPYTLTITSAADDTDYFAVKLKPGDVLGAAAKGANTYLTVYDTTPREVHGSQQDASFIYPMASPLPGGAKQVTDYVATKAGWHYIGVSGGSGAYDITVEGYRPPLQGAKTTQTLYLDFDGARINTGVFGGTGNVDLSPLSAFLGKWGIPRADEDRLIDAVVASVTENLKQDMVASGLNNRFKLKVLNSKDDPDPWGKPNVSRIVVGGTIAESGVPTIGISQSIDPGNFETQETAMVLLDVLSNPAGDEASLNTYLTPASDRVAFVGHALGNVVSHEGGHFFGNWHTDNSDAVPNLQDAGGANFGNLFGVGPDGVGGTADDTDVDFGDDRFSPAEGFVGTEDTLGRIVFGVTS
ncbi:PPC domain-containing protein [Krasilnikovia sp. MM14-A1259]|uniref:PPC domain-containing protein n=1 Tax=Krasilnikovia sp. MM14-A1259 TaxID=3373539 RepID=UPI0038259CAC